MKAGAESQIAFEIAQSGCDFCQVNIALPEYRGVFRREVGAPQVGSRLTADRAKLVLTYRARKGEGRRRARLLGRGDPNLDQALSVAGCGFGSSQRQPQLSARQLLPR